MATLKQYLLLFIFCLGATVSVFSDIHIYFFDVGQGNCILLRNETNAILIDAGSSNKTFRDIKDSFKECLGEAKIASIVLTHLDADHTNFVDTICSSEDPNGEKLTKDDCSIFSTTSHEDKVSLLEGTTLGKKPLGKRLQKIPDKSYSQSIDSIQDRLNDIITEGTFNFLKANWTNFSDIKNTNATCLVFSFTYQKHKVLFTGDSTGKAFERYIGQLVDEGEEKFVENVYCDNNRKIIQNTGVFVMPHHGSEKNGCWRWTLNVVKNSPNLRATIINVDASTSPYAHPRAWIKDVMWPKTMKGKRHYLVYNRGGKEFCGLPIQKNLFTTGSCKFIEVTISAGKKIDIKDHELKEEPIYQFTGTNKERKSYVRPRSSSTETQEKQLEPPNKSSTGQRPHSG